MSAGDLQLGLIGAGRWGRNYIKTIQHMDGIHLHRLASRNPQSRAWVGRNCAISENWQDVATAADLDGVIIAAPPDHHAKMAVAAIAAGIPVLIEKPLTLDVAQARALLDLATEKAATVLVDHIHLYHPAYVELKRQALGLGVLQSIRSAGGDWGPFRGDVSPLWDWAGHDLALCLDLLGHMPLSLSATVKESRQVSEGLGQILSIKLNFSNGVVADIECGNIMDPKKRFLAAHYDHETLIYDDLSATPLVRQPRADGPGCDPVHGQVIDVAQKTPLTSVIEAFAAAIGRASADFSDVQLGVKVIQLLANCEASLRQGSLVDGLDAQ